MKNLKTKTASVKKYVSDHRVAIAVASTSTVWVALMMNVAKQHNDFLKEHGLFDEFYNMDEDEN